MQEKAKKDAMDSAREVAVAAMREMAMAKVLEGKRIMEQADKLKGGPAPPAEDPDAAVLAKQVSRSITIIITISRRVKGIV